ncbi:MAG: 2-oxoacid:acceptor oxidoreductase subunit alpha [Candidatus Eremiobacteraeota bacterium]|nr:2-oxoacid:acceptor oxidoreductase subunit alpha [Candidatus Eremiobacteraeota bacterium]
MKEVLLPCYGTSWVINDRNNDLREIDYFPRFLQGNEACVEGALMAGLDFYGGYPITPSSEIAEILSRRLPQDGKVFIQMEDEIASIASCIGASLGGAKTMTATSGPGFSLMQENIGYAVMTEVPTVIVNVQRLGPSTGAPSSPAQGDVMQARWGSHGDHPILVLTPSSVKEAFELTVLAFNFAEKYRTPVILLSDEVVGHMREKILLPPREYLTIVNRKVPDERPATYSPYRDTDHDGVPALAKFGTGYRFHVTGLLHDYDGFPTSKADEINEWFERVFRKFEQNIEDIFLYRTYHTDDAEVLLISYGISARASRRAMAMARERGIKAGLLQLITLWPLNEKVILEHAAGKKLIVVPEMNRGQMVLEIERITGRSVPIRKVNRYDCHMIEPEAILEVMNK